MPVDTEKEVSKMHRTLHSTQNEIGKTYYRWRQVAIEFAGDNAKPLDVSLRAAEVFGKDIGKSFLPRMNWLKGEEGFLMILARSLAGLWNTEGGLATVEKGENPAEKTPQRFLSSVLEIHGRPGPSNMARPWKRSLCAGNACTRPSWKMSAFS
jgi:hypothetical protein